ncbi:putative HKD family nuclease [Thermoplasmatales archaeon]|nr:putative HKD family nuclease [Thermoplasmatales archaeon]
MPTLYEMVKEAVMSSGGTATNKEIIQYALTHYEHDNKQSMIDTINSASVNSLGRINYFFNQREVVEPREKYDFLFKLGRASVTLYNPAIHGIWGIKSVNGSFKVYRVDLQRTVGSSLVLYNLYSREDLLRIFGESEMTPTWRQSGIISVKTSEGDTLFFVTLGSQGIGEEWVDESGILRWHPQKHQKRSDPQIQRFKESNNRGDLIYLFIRVEGDKKYYYAGTLKYLSTVTNTDDRIFFNWQISPWPPNQTFSSNIVKKVPTDVKLEVLTQTSFEEEERTEKIVKGLSPDDVANRLRSLSPNPDEYIVINGKRLKRDLVAISLIKQNRGFKCQICGVSIKKENGGLYIEGAHIKAKSLGGKEEPKNILVLCPNHHKEFDYGSRVVLELNENLIRFNLNGNEYTVSLKIVV